jgi:hypothetical protein
MRTESPIHYLTLCDLNDYTSPSIRDTLYLCTAPDPSGASGNRIRKFIEHLDKRGARYSLVEESIPDELFADDDRSFIRRWKTIELRKPADTSRCRSAADIIGRSYQEAKDEAEREDRMLFGVFQIHTICSLTPVLRSDRFPGALTTFNRMLDTMFDHKSRGVTTISWERTKDYAKECDYDFVFHYIENKINLGKGQELLANPHLCTIVKNTYDEKREEYLAKNDLEPRDNRWTKLIIMMSQLRLLEEKELWIRKYASYQYSSKYPLFPQAWNRVWAFTRGLGIRTLSDLEGIDGIDIKEARNTICTYIPMIKDAFRQNIFNESREIVLSKYFMIRTFCELSITDEIDEGIRTFRA